MLDENELSRVLRLRNSAPGTFWERWIGRMQQEYERITGDPELPGDIDHHRLSHLGPPCESCGKPLRSLFAMLCGSCMAPAIRRGGKPGVGLFWRLPEQLIIDGVGLDEAIKNGELKTYPGTHEELWHRYWSIMAVPVLVRQESLARGRVVFDLVGNRLRLLADRCIIRDTAILDRICRYLNLPANTEIEADTEYRCRNCSSSS
jgi:hypothetical protein